MIIGGGFVGGQLARLAEETYHVIVVDRLLRPGLPESVKWEMVDIGREKNILSRLFRQIKPSVVVNTAAISDIDYAEKNPSETEEINVFAAGRIAELAEAIHAKHVYVSSDAIFDGAQSIYEETDPAHPVNVYGRSKKLGEKAVFRNAPKSIIVRISLVLGYPVTGGNSFLSGLEKKLDKNLEVLVPQDEIRTPIDVLTLCGAMLELPESGYAGPIHLGSVNSISRYELTLRLTEVLGFVSTRIIPVKSSMSPRRAPRHRNGILSVKKAQEGLETEMLSIEDTIKRALLSKA